MTRQTRHNDRIRERANFSMKDTNGYNKYARK